MIVMSDEDLAERRRFVGWLKRRPVGSVEYQVNPGFYYDWWVAWYNRLTGPRAWWWRLWWRGPLP